MDAHASPSPAAAPRLWPDSTIVCLGGGSLTDEDLERCHAAQRAGDVRVIAVNDAYRRAPWADVLYACDAKWWGWHPAAASVSALKFGLRARGRQHDVYPEGVTLLADTGPTGLELAPTGLRTGSNSGFQAINLAVHLGARRVLLLGYDMAPCPDGQSHWFGEHPDGQVPPFGMFLRAAPVLARALDAQGIEVINCSRHTALTVFPRQPLAEVLQGSEVTPVTTPAAPRVAVCLVTCGRYEYTRRTVATFLQHNDLTLVDAVHADDASADPRLDALAADAGFETVVRHRHRRGAQATRAALVRAAAARGADWVLMLENDWESARPIPWALFDFIRQDASIYCLRLYGQFKERDSRRPCFTKHIGRQNARVQWVPLVGAPEPAEVGEIHWGSPPALTRVAEALWLHEDTASDYAAGVKSGELALCTARVVDNVVYHIGADRTRRFQR